MKQGVDAEAQRKRARELSAKDIYTKRAKFSQNVHYLDKHTDKTLFVDSGKAITLRREALSESAVAVALELAKERFGSTLTIKGSEEFKRLVVEAVVKNGLDVHFTDKAMNQMLGERRAEVEAEREGASISAAGQAQPDPAGPEQASAASAEAEDPSLIQGVLLDHGDAPYKHDPKQNMSYYVRLMTEAGEKLYWGVGLKDAMEAQDFRLGQALRLKDLGTQPVLVRTRDERTGLEVERTAHRRGWAAEPVERVAPRVAAEAGQDVQADRETASTAVAVDAEPVMGSAILAREARWERNSGLSMAEVGTAPAMLGMRAEEHAVQVLFGEDGSEAGRERVASLMEHEAYRATFQQVVRDRTERLNPVLREELLVSSGYALARSLIEQAEQRYGAVPDAVQEAQKAQLEDQERQRQETDWIDVDAAIAAIEAQDRAFEAQVASEAPSSAPANRDDEARLVGLTPKERAAEQQASPDELPALREKHDRNAERRAQDKAFRQWSKDQAAADPGFAERSAKEKRAAFNAEREALSGAGVAEIVVETVAEVEIEPEEDGMQMD
ncbi:LPD7 domain-containing protein [Pseudomonas aeruginosa]|uniref:LPD7 domain-containing protein n=1 Tax=Pseudomonas aeruginosa TaxID=287 RepID=UPI0032B5C93A